jgi:hypothetical protein
MPEPRPYAVGDGRRVPTRVWLKFGLLSATEERAASMPWHQPFLAFEQGLLQVPALRLPLPKLRLHREV